MTSRRWLTLALACLPGLCRAEDAAPRLEPGAVQIGSNDKHLGPVPNMVAGIEVGVAGHYVRRGERLAGSGLSGRAYCEREFDGGLLFRAQAATFAQFRGLDFSESVYDVGLGLRNQSWLGRATLLAGYTYYSRNTNPANRAFVGDNTQELYTGVEFAGPGRPWAYVRWDFDGGAGRHNDRVGVYFMAGASHRVPVNRDIAVELGGRIGFDFGRGVNGFNDALLQSRLALRLSRTMTLSPAVDWWFPSGNVWPAVHGFQMAPSLNLTYTSSF